MINFVKEYKLDKTKLYYLASPYSHKSEVVRQLRKLVVDAVGSKLVEKGIHIFGPVTESACYSRMNPKIDGAWAYWKDHDLWMLDKCDAMLVLTINGWGQSVGVNAEIEYAKASGKDVIFIHLENIVPELWMAI